ncbi:MAG: DUF3857 domain-containing protein [Candidatus Omnitrophota bacterium]
MKKKKLIIGLLSLVIIGFLIFQLAPADYYAKLGRVFYKIALEKYKKENTQISRMKLGKLYFELGKYELAYETLSGINSLPAQKASAYALFKLNKFTEALAIFSKLGRLNDPEYLYYYGLTCEKSNLYDEAEKIYRKISAGAYKLKAEERLLALSHLVEGEVSADILTLLESSPGQVDYPEAGALILSVKEELEILPDNTSVSTSHILVKILNDRGKDAFSEVVLGYDSTYERVELDFARTIKPDGMSISVGDKNIRDVSVYLNFPLYSNARAKIISMPEVVSGCVIEYKARVYNGKLMADRHFSTAYFLQEAEPVVYSSFKLVVPKDRKLNIKVLNSGYNKIGADLNPKISQENGKTIYFLEIKNIPQIIPEPSMPPKAEIDTILLISSFTSWDEMFNWWSKLYKDKIIADENIKNKVKELTKGLVSDKDKAAAIYNFCAQEIRYVAVEYGDAGYEPHYASEIFLNKYGDCKDKAMLLITMLKEAGLLAYPVLIGTEGTIVLQDDFPMSVFNHAIAVLELNGEYIFLDPTAETVSFGDLPSADQARKVLVFFEEKFKIMTTADFGVERNFLRSETTIKINNDESILADRSVSASGIYEQAQRYWLIFTPPSLIEEAIKNKVQGFSPNGRLLDYKIENARDLNKKVIINYRFSGDDFLAKAGKARILSEFSGGVDVSAIVKDERAYPIYFGILSQGVDSIKISIPENLRFKYLPDSVYIDNEWTKFSSDYIVNGSTLEYRSEYLHKKKYIPVSEYQQYKNFIEGLARKLNQAIILEEVK